MILEYPVHAATSHVTAEIGALGENPSFSTGCCAGLDAIGWAAEQIRRGEALAVIAGGSDAPLSAYAIAAFHASGSLSIWKGPPAQASRPFDRRRSGFVLGEGAAAIVLEEEQFALSRGAKIYARLSGFGSASEGGELRTVDPDGAAAAMAMSLALAQAGRNPEDLDYVCAHGNSMINYDAAETAALKRTLGTHAWNVAISSIKSMCGHPLAAAGPMQVVTAALAIRTGIVPPTINYQYPDPDCDLDYVPNTARRVRIRNALVHAHSIGGTHSAAILSSVDGRQ
jgi:3-oxoacyl-(acyl-carrier-protein) synthase